MEVNHVLKSTNKSQQQIQQRKTVIKPVRFNYNTGQDLLNWLADKPFATYVKSLIRQDMEKQTER